MNMATRTMQIIAAISNRTPAKKNRALPGVSAWQRIPMFRNVSIRRSRKTRIRAAVCMVFSDIVDGTADAGVVDQHEIAAVQGVLVLQDVATTHDQRILMTGVGLVVAKRDTVDSDLGPSLVGDVRAVRTSFTRLHGISR
jgi:hypothetical protein